jgi:hypothetical protein
MMRRRIVHVLLSLLLLVSQQMAFAHAMSHFSGKLGTAHPAIQLVQGDEDSDLSSSVAKDRSCTQCLAFAQMASAIGSNARSFAPLDLQDERVIALATTEATPRTVCAFRSRAPPSFV